MAINPRSAFLALAAIILSPSIGLAGEIVLPWIKQKTATECGRAVLASVAARHGGDVAMFYRQLPAPSDPERLFNPPTAEVWRKDRRQSFTPAA